MKRLRNFTIFFTLAMIFCTVSIASAQTDCQSTSYAGGFVPLACAKQSPMLQDAYNSTSLGQYINTLFKIALSAGAILAVMRIAYAGYLYMGNDMWGKKQQAREILGDVTLGLLLLLSIFLILRQINPQLLNLDVLNSSSAASLNTGTTGQ